MRKKILITGCSGFIGFHLCKRLIEEGFSVLGIDNMNNYYDINLKKERLNLLLNNYPLGRFNFEKVNISSKENLYNIFKSYKPEIVINLAAQAGVRHSIENPDTYLESNVVGFKNILECCKSFPVEKFIYASSSSVYGGNKKIPFSEDDSVDHPVNLYAATKKTNELLAHCYSHLYSIPSIGLRFFTVYGPWGRPDMAPMLFANAILSRKPIKVNNNGRMYRDFTYIDDVIEFIMRIIPKKISPNKSFDRMNPTPSSSWAPHEIYNIGNSKPILLLEFINIIESNLNMKCIKEFAPMQKGEVKKTYANIDKIVKFTNYTPKTDLPEGISKFLKWFKEFYF